MARVLNAAALTHVAAAVSTLWTRLYFLWRSGLIGGRRYNSIAEGSGRRGFGGPP